MKFDYFWNANKILSGRWKKLGRLGTGNTHIFYFGLVTSSMHYDQSVKIIQYEELVKIHDFYEDFGHENIFRAILPLVLIQEEQLFIVKGERMTLYTMHW